MGNFIFFLDALKFTLAKSHRIEEISGVKEKLSTAITLLERNFPVAIQVYNHN